VTVRRRIVLFVLAAAAAAGAIGVWRICRPPQGPVVGQCAAIDRMPGIRPDYSGVTIPPNLAPPNFVVAESGDAYCVVISATHGPEIRIVSRSAGITIPPDAWRVMTAANKGGTVRFDVFVRDGGTWRQFAPITNTIAEHPIDRYLVYRRLKPLYSLYRDMGIYQRDLETYTESVVLKNTSVDRACFNCHTFRNHRTDRMLLHVRSREHGLAMVVVEDGKATKVDTRTKGYVSPAAYSAWRPSGGQVAFSVNRLSLFFHSTGETRDVWDAASDLGIYDTAAAAVHATPGIANPARRETWPTWSPDGTSLYFCSAPMLPPRQYKEVKYDLMCVSYDPAAG